MRSITAGSRQAPEEMNMTTVTNTADRSGRAALLLAGCLVAGVLAAAWVACGARYERARQDILDARRAEMGAWVSGTREAVELWADAQEKLVKRISTSELYRMFAQDVQALGGGVEKAVNEADREGTILPEDAASLAEQVPFMRGALLDFMNYNGLSDVRIVNGEGRTLLSAMTQPAPLDSEAAALVGKAVKAGEFLFGSVRAGRDGLQLDVADPMSAYLAGGGEDGAVAAVFVRIPVTGRLAQFLARDRQDDAARPWLLQRSGDGWTALGTDAAHSGPVVSLPLDAAGNMEFGRRVGVDGKSAVYSLGVSASGPNWEIILETPAAVVDARLRGMAWMIYGIGALASAGVVLLAALLWWVLISRRNEALARHFQQLYSVIDRQKRLLDSVNASLEVGLAMIDADGAVQMANRVFSELAADEGENAPDAAGRSLLSLFDVKTGELLVEAVRGVLQSGRTDTVELRMREGDVGERLLRVSLFPPYRGDGERGESRPGVVAIFQDITEFRRRSEQRQRQQANVMLALVRAIESVDPYLAGHSQKVAGLADLVGGQMGMDRASREGLRIAAALSQIGKLFIPRELLHKTGNLTPEERAEIMRAPEYAHDLLKDIDFGQPVAEAVYDMYEKLDGKGYPRGLSGESIPLASRVLGAVNTFCAMISPRSHREGLRREDAMDRLRKEPGFDPAVVEALDNVLRTPEGMSALLGG